jgi:hypothetical protein
MVSKIQYRCALSSIQNYCHCRHWQVTQTLLPRLPLLLEFHQKSQAQAQAQARLHSSLAFW